MSKNNSIVIWRIVFAYVIMFYHFDNKYLLTQNLPGSIGWYIGVEFFFVVSGFLLYSKLDEYRDQFSNGLCFMINRVKRIYPIYFLAFVLCFLFIWIRDRWSLHDAVWAGGSHVFEMLALQGAGLDMGWDYINNTGWFVSVLFISEFIIYHCLVKWKDTMENFVLPITIIVCFSYLYRNMNGIGAASQTTGFYENWGLMRGLLDMSMGVMAARWNKELAKKFKNTQILRLLGSVGFILVLLLSLFIGNTSLDFVYLIIIAISVAFAFLPSESKVLGSKVIRTWSKTTLCLYLFHDMFRTSVFPIVFGYSESVKDRWVLCIVYMLTVTVFAFAVDYIYRRIIERCFAKHVE